MTNDRDTILLESGHDSLRIPKICLGTGSPKTKESGGLEPIFDAFFEEHCFIDTARVYGNLLQRDKGGAEAEIGAYLKRRGLADKVIISTKGGHPPIYHMKGDRLTGNQLEKDIDLSLKYLQRDYVDLYFLHRDNGGDLYEIMRILDGFVKAGKTRFLGASNWTTERIAAANRVAEENGFTKFVISQLRFSLAEQTKKAMFDSTSVYMDDAEEENYRKMEMPVMAAASLARGFFSKYPDVEKTSAAQYMSEVNEARAKRVAELAEAKQVSRSAVAGRYLMDIKPDTVLLFSASRKKQLEETLQADTFRLSPEEVRYLKTGE